MAEKEDKKEDKIVFIHPGDLPIHVDLPVTETIRLQKPDQDHGYIIHTYTGEHEGRKFEFSVLDPLMIVFRQSKIIQPVGGTVRGGIIPPLTSLGGKHEN